MDCYSVSLFVVCFDVMIMMTLIFPRTETKMAFTHTDGVCHHCAASGLLLLNGWYDGKHNFIAMEVSGKDKFGSGFHFFPTKLLLHQM